MKSLKIAAALGLMVAGVGISTEATAQRYDGYRHGYDHRDYRDGRRGYYGHDRGYGYGRGGYYGRGYGYHRGGYGYRGGWRGGRDCRTTWRYHRPVTVCYR
jgi:hypothetical protein